MGLLIDASVLIEYERGRIALEGHMHEREDDEVFLSVITASELLHGVYRAHDPGVRNRRSAWVEAVLERFPMLVVDLATARTHARLWAQLSERGRIIGPHDLWLAAACLAHGLTMATADVREFRRVPGLEIQSWSSQGT